MLDAAMAIVVEDGPTALTIARLAARLDSAVGALYRYFPGKDALMVALQRRAIDAFGAALEADLASAEEHLEQARLGEQEGALFLAMAPPVSYLLDGVRTPQRHQLMDAFLSDPERLLSDEDAMAVNVESLAPILERCGARLGAATDVGALEPGDVRQRTHVLWAALHGLGHMTKRDTFQPPELQVPSLLRATLRAVLSGWGARAAALEEAERELLAWAPDLFTRSRG